MSEKRYDGPSTCIIITSSCSFREYIIIWFFTPPPFVYTFILLLTSPLLFFYIYRNVSNQHGSSREGPANHPILINICYSNDVLAQRHIGTGKKRGLMKSFTPKKKIFIYINYGVDMKREAVLTVFIEWLVGS